MSKLGEQIKELRTMADAMHRRSREIGLDYGMGRGLADASRMLREAADTIESMQDRLQPVPAELDYVEDKSMWAQLFGTPERAAEYFAMQCFGSDGGMCCYCPFDDCDEKLRNSGAYPPVYDAILEWLRGDA